MLGAIDWANLHVAGAFLLGAILATVATLRVVRAVTNYFVGVDRQRRLPRETTSPDNDDDTREHGQ